MVIGFDASRAFVADRTGTENYSYHLLQAMIAVGGPHSYRVYTREATHLMEDFLQHHVTVQSIGWPRLWTQGGLALATWADHLDVLFVPAHTLPVLRKPGLATVVTIHGLEYEYLPEYYRYPQRLYLTWSTRYAAQYATKVIAVSQFTADELVRRLGADRKNIRVVHEGVDRQRFERKHSQEEKSRILAELGIRKPYILFVGVVQPRKNLERLIEAFSRVRRMIPAGSETLLRTVRFFSEPEGSSPNHEVLRTGGLNRRSEPEVWAGAPVKPTLVIAGKMGWMYQRVLAAPKKFGVEEAVVFTGYVHEDRLPILMQEAQVYVQPSLSEGFGLPVLEAMAAGTPVVAARAGALPEIVGEAAMLVKPEDIDGIARALLQAIVESGRRKSMHERGLSWSRRYSWERTAHETLNVLGEAVATKRG